MLSTIRPLRALALSALIAAGLVVATPVAASAHDRLVSSTPAADAVVTELPTQLTLTFNAELTSDPGTVVLDVVSVTTGENIAADAPVVEGVTVTRPLGADIAAGGYTVLWKVVSSDGHPISGQYSFAVDAAAVPPASTSSPTASATLPATSPTASPSPTPTAIENTATTASSPGADLVLAMTIATAVLVGGGLLVVVIVVIRKRRSSAGGAR